MHRKKSQWQNVVGLLKDASENKRSAKNLMSFLEKNGNQHIRAYKYVDYSPEQVGRYLLCSLGRDNALRVC